MAGRGLVLLTVFTACAGTGPEGASTTVKCLDPPARLERKTALLTAEAAREAFDPSIYWSPTAVEAERSRQAARQKLAEQCGQEVQRTLDDFSNYRCTVWGETHEGSEFVNVSCFCPEFAPENWNGLPFWCADCGSAVFRATLNRNAKVVHLVLGSSPGLDCDFVAPEFQRFLPEPLELPGAPRL